MALASGGSFSMQVKIFLVLCMLSNFILVPGYFGYCKFPSLISKLWGMLMALFRQGNFVEQAQLSSSCSLEKPSAHVV